MIIGDIVVRSVNWGDRLTSGDKVNRHPEATFSYYEENYLAWECIAW